MRPIWEAWFCHIEVTNVCGRGCLYCSRYDRHIRKDQRFFMDLKMIENALDSLEGWPHRIGIIGGEPTFHPRFEEICRLLQSRYGKGRYGLWTTGGKRYEKYKKLINETFGMLAYNEHNPEQEKTCRHQPLTIAIQDAVEDPEYRKKLIDECWVQRMWCPSIGPKGAFFCEVAYALDTILDGPGGYPVKPNWWKKTPEQFKDQVEQYCKYCGMPVPIERELIKNKRERITPKLYSIFRQHNLARLSKGDIILFNRKLMISEMDETKKTWDPSNYREDIRSDVKDGWKERWKK